MNFRISYVQLLLTRFRMENLPESELRINVAVVHKNLDISSQG